MRPERRLKRRNGGGGFGRPSFTFASAKLPARPSVNQVRNMGWLFAGVFLLVALGNLGIALRWYAHRKSGSLVPLIGGPSGVGACVMLPFNLCGTGGGYR